MAISVSDIEKKYAALMRQKNSPISFGEYAKGKDDSIGSEFGDMKESAMLKSAKKLSGYGTLTESLGALGLSDGGWAKHIKDSLIAERDASLEKIGKEERSALDELRSDYSGYLSSYKSKQDSLRRSIVETLTSEQLIEPEQIYKYAASAGLGESGAKDLYSDIYTAVSPGIKQSILDKFYANEISAEMAESMAKSMMLNSADVAEIRRTADEYNKSIERESDKYIDYLESLGGKVTTRFHDPLYPFSRNSKNKKG